MKYLNRTCCTLGVFMAAVLFAACGGSRGFIGQPATGGQVGNMEAKATSSSDRPLSLAGETFSATNARRHCQSNGQNYTRVEFDAYGYAAGPLPGTFNVHGRGMYYCPRGCRSLFKETFSIAAGSRHVYGAAQTNSFGMNCPPPRISGTADFALRHQQQVRGTTYIIFDNRSFSEKFQ